jgi:hypothetical protein
VKKFFIMLGTWFVLIITVIVGSIVYSQYKTSEYDEAAVTYLERVIPELSKWDAEKTRQLMTPESLDNIPAEQFVGAINLFSRLGELRSIETPKLSEVRSEEKDQKGQDTIIEYTIDAKYANDDATITINLRYKDGHFSIYHFKLSSKILGS